MKKNVRNSQWGYVRKSAEKFFIDHIIGSVFTIVFAPIAYIYRAYILKWFFYGYNKFYIAIPLLVALLYLSYLYIIFRKKYKEMTTVNKFFKKPKRIWTLVVLVVLSIGIVWYVEDIYLPNRPLPNDKFVIAIAKPFPFDDSSNKFVSSFVDNLKSDINKKVADEQDLNVKVIELDETLACPDASDGTARKKIKKLGRQNMANVVVCGKIRNNVDSYNFNSHIIETTEVVVPKKYLQDPIDSLDKNHSLDVTINPRFSKNEKYQDNVSNISDFTLFIYGYANWSWGNKDTAKKIFSSLENKEDYSYDWSNLAVDFYNNAQYYETLPYLELSLAIDENNIDALEMAGITYSYIGEYDNALKALKSAIGINPENFYSQLELGIAYDELDKYDDAITTYINAIRLGEKNNLDDYEMGSVYYGLGNAYYDLFVSKTVATKNIDLDILNKARDSFQTTTELVPKSDVAHANLGSASLYLGKFDDAKIAYEKSIDLNPNNTIAQAGLIAVNSGEEKEKIMELLSGEQIESVEYNTNYTKPSRVPLTVQDEK